MSDIYDPIIGQYYNMNMMVNRTKKTAVLAGTKRQITFDDEQAKKIKREKDMEKITLIEKHLNLYEKWNLSSNLQSEIFAFREKITCYKRKRV